MLFLTLRPKLTMRTKGRTKKKKGRKLKISSTTSTLTTRPKVHGWTMIADIASWTDAEKLKPAWMLKNKQRFCDSDMEIGGLPKGLETRLLCLSDCYFPASTTPVYGLLDAKKGKSGRSSSQS